jgi:hypothetical protein
MRFIALILLIFIWPPGQGFYLPDIPFHPLHLSVTNITLENGKLKISMKTFRDDWETAYFHYHSEPIDLTDSSQREGGWFRKYLDKSFRISRGTQQQWVSMELDTVWLAGEAMTIEMHATFPGEPNSLYIYNAILTDIFPDQTNLVVFGFNNRETGIKFDVKKLGAEVKLK